MFTKIVVAIVGLLIALVAVRIVIERAERARLRADRQPADRPGRKVVTLEADPETGVYRPRD